MGKYTLGYGPNDSYVVRNPQGKVIYSSISKCRAIKRAQEANGYKPMDGDENTYGKQSNQFNIFDEA